MKKKWAWKWIVLNIFNIKDNFKKFFTTNILLKLLSLGLAILLWLYLRIFGK